MSINWRLHWAWRWIYYRRVGTWEGLRFGDMIAEDRVGGWRSARGSEIGFPAGSQRTFRPNGTEGPARNDLMLVAALCLSLLGAGAFVWFLAL